MNLLRAKLYLSFLKAKPSAFQVEESSYRRIYIFLAADYGNLGDVAITFAQNTFIHNKNQEAEVVEIPISKTFAGIKAVKNILKKDDIITIVGGGNMGDLYDDIEYLRQLVIKSFKKNEIVSFPQTIDFSNTKYGQARLSIAKRVYNSHPRLTLLAREQVSFERMKSYFPKAKVILTPDIVMTLDKREPFEKRKGAVLCLRDDKEKLVSHLTAELHKALTDAQYDITYKDTHIGRDRLSPKEIEEELNTIWSTFRHAEFVVTDRLHGMIFAFITGTPAIVLPNNNFKVASCYEWIKDCGFIVMAKEESAEKLLEQIKQVQDNFNAVSYQIKSQFVQINI